MKRAFVGPIAAFAVITVGSLALAAEGWDAIGGKGEVTVKAKGAFHVNKEYPWSATDSKGTKVKFTFDGESAAKATGLAAGSAHVKGAVCNNDKTKCVPFETDVTVN